MGKPRSSSSSSTAPRIERKVLEKNRRNRLKVLYYSLISLLPNHTSKEELPLPDQMDEAAEYIKALKMKLDKMKEKKESLLPTNNSYSWITTENQATNKKSLLVEVHEMGPNMYVILANGLKDYSTFQGIISLLHQHGFEIANAIFSLNGNSSIQVFQDKDGKSQMEFGGASISPEWLKELICGNTSCSGVVESQFNLWDFGFETNLWNFDQILEVFSAEI
ncbi:hypothetical protein ACJIZ3_010727 [Penstemon smallii]|uniref:BHLH domain-containing protein n=1 Tax=Penstemon smallii TaxID=265156 RepID=A0ABD3UKP6_9LAMI